MPAPALVLTDARVLTMDDDGTEAEAIAFQHGRVLAVGSESEVRARAGDRAAVEGLDGACVIPGFVDCHTHAARLGEMHWRHDLNDTATKDEALQLLAWRAERTPAGGWVIGWNWDETRWGDRDPITQADLDGVSTQHNLLARRVCGHRAVVNTPALDELPIDAGTPGTEPTDGGISGQLSEDAAYAAWEACAPTYDTCVKGLKIESRRLAELGITAVADTAGPREIRLLTQGAREGFVLQRSGLYITEELLEHVSALQLGPIRSDTCSVHGVKIYTDGSIGARTAALREAYADDETTGMLLRDADAVERVARACEALGLQLKAHAIGDRAIDAVLDGIQQAEVDPSNRPRIEHAEVLHPDHLERMRVLGVVCVMQPNFAANWQGKDGLYEHALGPGRARRMNPFRDVLDAGVPLAFSSDGMPYDPLYGIQAACEHPDPSQQLTVEEALNAYTRGAAYALGREHELGVLQPGALADAVVLSQDPRSAPDLGAVEVQRTIIDGRFVTG